MFEYEDSDTFKILDEDTQNLEYGSASVEGLYVADDIYLDEDFYYGIDQFEFVLALDGEGLEEVSGIHGYSRNVKTELNDGSYYEPGPLYYYYLYEEGYINSPSFATFIADYSETSYVEIGEADFDKYA